MKVCRQCGIEKPLLEFYRHPKMADGHLNTCKECKRAYAIEHHHEKMHDADWVESQRKRGRGKYHRLYARGRRWVSPKAPQAVKRAANVILGNAVRDGRVLRPDRCQQCGREGCRIEGHHEDYYKPLVVEWLCRVCHANRHYQSPAEAEKG